MSLADWVKSGWLRAHKPTKGEITNLFEIIERDLNDAAAKGISDDWKYDAAGNISSDEAHELIAFCLELRESYCVA